MRERKLWSILSYFRFLRCNDIDDIISEIKRIVEKTVEFGFCSDEEEIRKSLERLRVSYLAYELHKARNVYNDAYANWWNVAGEDWDNFFRGN